MARRSLRIRRGSTAGPAWVNPGDNIVSICNAAAAGATVYIRSGTYRLSGSSWIIPKANQKFIAAEPGVIFNGSIVQTSWTQSGNYWFKGIGAPGNSGGECDIQWDASDTSLTVCKPVEDLFVDGAFFPRVNTQAEVDARTCWLDTATNNLYVNFNPSGHLMEVSNSPVAFENYGYEAPNIDNVVIDGFTFRQFASSAQNGVVHNEIGTAWVIQHCTFEKNHGGAVRINGTSKILNCKIVENGQRGFGIVNGTGAEIGYCEIARNNIALFSIGWEAGGAKLTYNNNTSIHHCHSHHNLGPGLWSDANGINTVWDTCTLVENYQTGITEEISPSDSAGNTLAGAGALIKNCTFLRNGNDWFGNGWAWNPSVSLQNSRNATVQDSYFEMVSESGNGVSISYQNRVGTNSQTFNSDLNTIQRCTFVQLPKVGRSNNNGPRNGFYSDSNTAVAEAWTQTWANNTYIRPVGSSADNAFYAQGSGKTWAQWQALAHDTSSSMTYQDNTMTPYVIPATVGPTRFNTADRDLDFTKGDVSLVTTVRSTIGTYLDGFGYVRTAAANVPRVNHLQTNGLPVPQGLLCEAAATNLLLRSRDFTNASWVKTSMSAVRNLLGRDYTYGTATALTATSANATVLQTVTLASNAVVFSIDIRAATLTGAIQITVDGGATWTNLRIRKYWQRLWFSATVTNPSVGLRIVNSGDVLQVDYAQLETGTLPTSRIETSTATVTRAADDHSMTESPSSAFAQASATLIVDARPRFGTGSATQWMLSVYQDASNYMSLAHNQSAPSIVALDNVAASLATITAGTQTSTFPISVAWSFEANAHAVALNAAAAVTNTTASIPPAPTAILIGTGRGGAASFDGHIARVRIYRAKQSAAFLSMITRA